MPSYRCVCDLKLAGCFQLLSNYFHYLQIIVIKNYNRFFLLCYYVLYYQTVAEHFYGVVPYHKHAGWFQLLSNCFPYFAINFF